MNGEAEARRAGAERGPALAHRRPRPMAALRRHRRAGGPADLRHNLTSSNEHDQLRRDAGDTQARKHGGSPVSRDGSRQRDAGDEATTEQAAGFDGKPELTNRWFSAYRLTLAPGQKTPTHRHRAPVVIFQATSGKGFGNGPMKFEFNEPGQWAFFDASAEHEIGNLRHRPAGAHRGRGPRASWPPGSGLESAFFSRPGIALGPASGRERSQDRCLGSDPERASSQVPHPAGRVF